MFLDFLDNLAHCSLTSVHCSLLTVHYFYHILILS